MIPHIKEVNNTKVLYVQDKPYIMLAGEVHNSNSSSIEYMEGVWDKALALGMNSLLLPVSWEMIEPEEGKFDFRIVDRLIDQARRKDKRIGFLWFGTWKNAECMYAPAWVKKDLSRFQRAQTVKGQNKSILPPPFSNPYTTLSYLCEETLRADSKAFAMLMAHIREIDEVQNTVITMQVENETGVLGAAREYSDEADNLFAGKVPSDFAEYMCVPEKSWTDAFGEDAEEYFSAYYISKYVGEVTRAGKEEYPLPMTVNCWLNKSTDKPGMYPTGGPVAKVHKIWRFNAPEIDAFCPDIYIPEFCDVCDDYTKDGNPLYIPECATHSYAAPRMVYCVGHHHAMCYSPFGFEDMGLPFNIQQGFLFGMDVHDPALKVPQSVEEYYTYSHILENMMPLLTEAYGSDRLQAVCSERAKDNCIKFG